MNNKRYTINNRRSDCLLKEKLIAEASEEAASKEAAPRRQHKVFDDIQYLNSLGNLPDLMAIKAASEILHQSPSVIPNLPDINTLFASLGTVLTQQQETYKQYLLSREDVKKMLAETVISITPIHHIIEQTAANVVREQLAEMYRVREMAKKEVLRSADLIRYIKSSL